MPATRCKFSGWTAAAIPDGEVRERYRMRNPGWVLVRPDQVVAARGAGADFSALQTYAAHVLRARPDA